MHAIHEDASGRYVWRQAGLPPKGCRRCVTCDAKAHGHACQGARKGEMGSLDGQPGMILELRLGEVPPADPLGR